MVDCRHTWAGRERLTGEDRCKKRMRFAANRGAGTMFLTMIAEVVGVLDKANTFAVDQKCTLSKCTRYTRVTR